MVQARLEEHLLALASSVSWDGGDGVVGVLRALLSEAAPFDAGEVAVAHPAGFQRWTLTEDESPLAGEDLLMHVSAMDLQRNLEQAIASDESHQFDSFAPGWRGHVDQKAPAHTVRRGIIEYWIGRVQALGFSVFEHEQFELLRGTRRQPLYWLALAAKNEKASEFWDKIRHVDPQQGLGF